MITPAGQAGMTSSAQHAEDDAPGWGERAYQEVISSPYLRLQDFTMDFARNWAYACGLDHPAEERAWGSVTQKLIRTGGMKRVGYAPVSSSNGSAKPLYRLMALPTEE